MKKLHVGQRVIIDNPSQIAARFWDGERIVGAGGMSIPRDLLDAPAYVVSISGKGKTSDRGLIALRDPDGNLGMWLDASVLKPAPRARCTGTPPHDYRARECSACDPA